MKKIIGFIPTWIIYYIGHWLSLLERFISPKIGILWLYELSNYFLITSTIIQDWAGLNSPWEEPKNEPNLEIERRWLLTKIPDVKFDDILYIKQYYTEAGRFRDTFNDMKHIYHHTIKRPVSVGIQEEDEIEITKEEFDLAIAKPIAFIDKYRFIYKVDGLKYEMDQIFLINNETDFYVLEIELNDINQPLELVKEVQDCVIKEITGDKSLSNFSLSYKY